MHELYNYEKTGDIFSSIYLIHKSYDLENQLILSQIITILKHCLSVEEMSLLKPNSALLSGIVDFTFQISQRQITQYKSINHLNSNQEGRHVLMIKIIFLFKYQTLILFCSVTFSRLLDIR